MGTFTDDPFCKLHELTGTFLPLNLLDGSRVTTMSQRSTHIISLMALVMAGLFLGTCVTALAAVGSPPTGTCGPGTAEEIGAAKAPIVSLWASAGPTVVLPIDLSTSARLLPPIPSPLRSALLWGNLVSRAPPTLL